VTVDPNKPVIHPQNPVRSTKRQNPSRHASEKCPTPRKRRRRRNSLWLCPTCGQLWVLRYDNVEDWGGTDDYDMGTVHAHWTWLRYPGRHGQYAKSADAPLSLLGAVLGHPDTAEPCCTWGDKPPGKSGHWDGCPNHPDTKDGTE
jgi:hypothetical protein